MGTTNYNYSCFGHLAQLGEHPLDVRKVTGSSPVVPTISKPITSQHR